MRAGTHWLSVGKHSGGRTSGIVVNAGASVTGGRTGNIVGVLGPGLLVDVTAALWKCRARVTGARTSGIGRTPARATNHPNWRATDPKHRRAPTPKLDRYRATFEPCR